MNNNPNNNSQQNSQFSFTPNFGNQPNNSAPTESPNTFVPQENFNENQTPSFQQAEPIKNPIRTNSRLDLAQANVTTSGKAPVVIILLYIIFFAMLIVGIIGFSLNIGEDLEAVNVGNFINELFEEDNQEVSDYDMENFNDYNQDFSEYENEDDEWVSIF